MGNTGVPQNKYLVYKLNYLSEKSTLLSKVHQKLSARDLTLVTETIHLVKMEAIVRNKLMKKKVKLGRN